MEAIAECMDTAEVERMTSLELVAPAKSMAVLCQLSYIRKIARRATGQYRGRLAATC